jgi:hypothetical protein
MVRPSLIPCESCFRHFRFTEHACPFCGAAPPPRLASVKAPALPRARLSRAALAFGASALTAVASACGGVSVGTGDKDAGVEDGGRSDGREAPDAHCQSAALYGGFPGEPCIEPDADAPDASTLDSGGEDVMEPTDAVPTPDCDVISHADYGAPPHNCP